MDYPTVFDLIAKISREAGARLILIVEEDYHKLKGLFLAQGYEETVHTDIFVKQSHKDRSAMPIDLLFVDRDTFESIWRSSGEATVSGHVFKTPSLLHLIALKLHAIKTGSKDRAWKDLPDIIRLVIANRINVESSDFVEICKKFGPAGIQQKIKEASCEDSDGRA